MIPTMNIIAWGNKVPWAAQRQVEQDLIISRALVEMFTSSSYCLRSCLFRPHSKSMIICMPNVHICQVVGFRVVYA